MFFKSECNKPKRTFSKLRRFLWDKRNVEEVAKPIEEAYEKIVFWKKNLLMLRAGAARRSYTIEVIK